MYVCQNRRSNTITNTVSTPACPSTPATPISSTTWFIAFVILIILIVIGVIIYAYYYSSYTVTNEHHDITHVSEYPNHFGAPAVAQLPMHNVIV